MPIAAMTHEQRFRSSPNEELWRCVICDTLWPSRQIRFQDGIESDRRCPNHYAPDGGEIARDLRRAAASELAASLTAQYAAPPLYGGWADPTTAAALLTFSARPLRLSRGGPAVALTIEGTNLAADDEITYGHAGVTDSVAPALTPVTYDSDGNALTPFVDVLALTVQASVAVPAGLYALIYEGGTYQRCFDVR